MGSKNLKAIVVKGHNRIVDVAQPEKYEELRKSINSTIKESLAAGLTGENGTAANLEVGMFAGDVPIRNFTSNFNEEMGDALGGSALADNYLTRRRACAYCSIACKRVVEVKDGPFNIPNGSGPEYETIVAFGSLMNSDDLAASCKAGRICNDFGMDTISAGVTIAWAMEAAEKGDLSITDLDSIDLKWSDLETVVEVILPKIAQRDGKLGNLLQLLCIKSGKTRSIIQRKVKAWKHPCMIPEVEVMV